MLANRVVFPLSLAPASAITRVGAPQVMLSADVAVRGRPLGRSMGPSLVAPTGRPEDSPVGVVADAEGFGGDGFPGAVVIFGPNTIGLDLPTLDGEGAVPCKSERLTLRLA